MVEDVVIPLTLRLFYHSNLLKQQVLDVTSINSRRIPLEVEARKLAESRRIVVPQRLGVAEGLEPVCMTSLKMRRNTSTLLDDTEAIPALLDRLPDFDALFERLSPAQVDAILDEQLSSDNSAEGRSSETAKYGPANGKSEVDRAFNELMSG